jgi:hypothetical protein
MKVYCRSHVGAELECNGVGCAGPPDCWCADRRLQRNVIQLVERGLLTDGDVRFELRRSDGPSRARRLLPEPAWRPWSRSRPPYPSGPTTGTGVRRVRRPSVLEPQPALAAASEDHRRLVSTPCRVTLWRAMASGARDGTDQPREKNESPAACITSIWTDRLDSEMLRQTPQRRSA